MPTRISPFTRLPQPIPQQPLSFGWGGKAEDGRPRPLPNPSSYRFVLNKGGVRIQNNQVRIDSSVVNQVYERVFRDSLDKPGFAVISISHDSINRSSELFRKAVLDLSEKLGRKRTNRLNYERSWGLIPNLLTTSSRMNSCSFHRDVNNDHEHSMILLGYEPSRDVDAHLSVVDLSQLAKDHGKQPHELVQSNLKQEYVNEAVAYYRVDLTGLDPRKSHIIVLNDNMAGKSTRHVRGMSGVLHGVMQVRQIGPNPHRPLNQMVFSMGEKSQAPSAAVIQDYVRNGEPYRLPRFIRHKHCTEAPGKQQ